MVNYKKVQLLLAVVLTLLVVTAVSSPFHAVASSHELAGWTSARGLAAPPAPEQQDGPGEPTPDDNYEGAPLPTPVPLEQAAPVQDPPDDNYDGAPLIAPVQQDGPGEPTPDDNYDGAPLIAPVQQDGPAEPTPDDNDDGTPLTAPAPAAQAAQVAPVQNTATSASESVVFPATGDVVTVQDNPYWWHDGDFAQGNRTLALNQITGVRYDLVISSNLLSDAGHVDLSLSINGIVVGSFTVLPGQTARTVAFSFPPIHGPNYTIRLEETNTVDSGLGSIIIPLDTSTLTLGNFFPATGDIVTVQANPYWWHAGDFAQGVRTPGLDQITGVKYDLVISNNSLTGAGHVDLSLSINGILVGSFTVLPGETARTVSFFFPPIHGPNYTIRLEETNTVDSGLGSIAIPLDTSTITLGNFFPATGDVVTVQSDPYWWHAGDFAQGVRTPGLDQITGVRYDLVISNNLLTGAGHVDLSLSINGILVGSFTVLPGETARTVSFFFPPISGPNYTIRLEETNTVGGGLGSIVIPRDTSSITYFDSTTSPFFPATGDVVTVQSNPYWWHDGDFAQGVRTPGFNQITGVRYHLVISNNVLTGAGHVDLSLSINGIVVGGFTVLPGETTKSVSFSFSRINGPNYVVRLEEINTVGGGLGSIIIPLDTSTILFVGNTYIPQVFKE